MSTMSMNQNKELEDATSHHELHSQMVIVSGFIPFRCNPLIIWTFVYLSFKFISKPQIETKQMEIHGIIGKQGCLEKNINRFNLKDDIIIWKMLISNVKYVTVV